MGREYSRFVTCFPPAGVLLAAMVAMSGCAQTQSTSQAANPPAAPAGVMNVADAAISGGDPSMALKVSQAALASNPQDLDALYHEGAAYYAMNRCMDAIAVYKVALGLDTRSAEAEVGIGRCLLKRNAVEAEQAFEAAVRDDPNNATALNDLGVARDLQGNHAGAVDPYQKALLLQPGTIATEVNIGMSLALSGDGDDALQYLGPLATSQDATPKIRQDYAAALVAAGRDTEARAVLAVDLPPDGVNQLMADFGAAIAAGTPPAATASNGGEMATPPTTPTPAVPAPVQAVPLANATTTQPPARLAVAQMPASQVGAAGLPVQTELTPAAPTQAAPGPAAPGPAAPPAVITPMITASAPDTGAMAPASLPSASLAVPSQMPPPAVPSQVAPPPGAQTTSDQGGAAAGDTVVR
jgi:Flp pilus assembly protein TadD